MQAFTTGLKLDTLMLLDAFAGGTMKIKTVVEVQEKIDNMSLNEYQGHTEGSYTYNPRAYYFINQFLTYTS